MVYEKIIKGTGITLVNTAQHNGEGQIIVSTHGHLVNKVSGR